MQNNDYSQIPFSERQVMTEDDGQNIYIHHNWSEVLSDYNHTELLNRFSGKSQGISITNKDETLSR